MPVRRVVAVVAALALTLLVAACGPEEEQVGYTPVPDEELFAQVAELPSVEDVSLAYVDRFGQANSYAGDVYVDGSRPAAEVLDEVLAVLWQGRPDAGVTGVSVSPPADSGQVAVLPGDVGLDRRTALEERYGDQPGTGVPPADAEPLRTT